MKAELEWNPNSAAMSFTGGLVFIDLRDNTGIVQLIAKDPSILPDVRNEYVVEAKGVVEKKDVPNKNLATGEIEIALTSLRVINKAETTPFIIADKSDALEETRLKERFIYLDPRINFHEIDRYFFSGCTCAFFEIAIDKFTDLRYNPDEWEIEPSEQ